MTTLAKNVAGKSWNLSVQWNGNRYSESADVPAFTAPSGLSASESSGTITLNWTNGTASAETIVERSLTGDGGWTTIATKTPTTATHADSPGGSGTFYYRISHTQNSLQTSYSSTVNATITYVPPIADGDEVTVTISGAGSNVDVSQFSFLGGSYGPVELASDAAVFNTFMPTGWGMPGGAGTRVSTELALNGTKSLKHDPTINGPQFGFNYNTGGIRRVGFARYHFYFENPSNLTVGQIKQVRFSGGTSSGNSIDDSNYANLYMTTRDLSRYIPRNDSPTLTTLYGGHWYQPNEWIAVEFRATDCSAVNVADGSFTVTCYRESTGEVIGTTTRTGIVTRTSADALIRYIVFQFWMGNGYGAGSGCRAFIDRDVAVAWSSTTTPPKYILLGDASTFTACTVRTYCEWTSWVDNGATSDITIKVNQGRHANLTGKYVYAMSDAGTVINSTGVALS